MLHGLPVLDYQPNHYLQRLYPGARPVQSPLRHVELLDGCGTSHAYHLVALLLRVLYASNANVNVAHLLSPGCEIRLLWVS